MAPQSSETYIPQIVSQLGKMNIQKVQKLVNFISDKLKIGNTLFIAGNGGSASSANHIAADLSNQLYHSIELYKGRVVSLCASVEIITAIANDFGYEQTFVRQMAHCISGDMILLMSVSGASPNIIAALREGKRKQMTVVAITGKESILSQEAHHTLIFGDGDYGHAEDFQTIFHHMLKRKLASECE